MIHASRTGRFEAEVPEKVNGEKSLAPFEGVDALSPVSGERVSNTWVICPKVGNNCSKGQLIPHVVRRKLEERDFVSLWDEPAAD